MTRQINSDGVNSLPPISSVSVLFARVTWVLVGPAVLFFVTYEIVADSRGWLTMVDAIFAIVVGLMLLARWVEHRSGTATLLTGELATNREFHRYLLGLPLAAACMWAGANWLGNHVLK